MTEGTSDIEEKGTNIVTRNDISNMVTKKDLELLHKDILIKIAKLKTGGTFKWFLVLLLAQTIGTLGMFFMFFKLVTTYIPIPG